MSKNLHVIGGSVLGALALMAVSVMPASAADTVTTFEMQSGTVSLSAAAAVTTLDSSVAVGDLTYSGPLGNVVVTDLRAGVEDWDVTVAAGAFIGMEASNTGVTANLVTYTPGALTETGVNGAAVTAATSTLTDTRAATDAPISPTTTVGVVGTEATSGNNTSTWNPTLSVTLPSDARAGDYQATVVTSLL